MKYFGRYLDLRETKLQENGESHIMLSYMHIIVSRYVAHMKQSRNAYRVLMRKPEGNRPLGRPRRKREDSIKMDLKEVVCDRLDRSC